MYRDLKTSGFWGMWNSLQSCLTRVEGILIEPFRKKYGYFPPTNLLPAILAVIALAAGGGFFGYQRLKEKQKEKEAAKPDPDADYVDDDEDYGYVADDVDDLDFSDEEDNEPV